MAEPFYKGLQQESIPHVSENDGLVTVHLVSGEMDGEQGPFTSDTGVQLSLIEMDPGGFYSMDIPREENIFFYLINGKVEVNGQPVAAQRLVEFLDDDVQIDVFSKQDSRILLGHALPLNEPMVSQGPFVMNTREEIEQAYADYRNGKFGSGSF